MQEIEQILRQMESILDQLNDNAKKLGEVSLQVIAQEELIPLQEKQEKLITELTELDKGLHKSHPKEIKNYQSKTRERVDQKLEAFQKLNAQFIDNVTSRQGLIQFEISKSKRPKK